MKILQPLVVFWCITDISKVRGCFICDMMKTFFGYNSDDYYYYYDEYELATLDEFFQTSQHILFGQTEVETFKALNELCSVLLTFNTIKPLVTPNMNSISLRLHTPCKEYKFTLSHADRLLYSTKFDVSKKVAIFVPGWMSGTDTETVSDMAKAYHCRGGYNFLALNTAGAIDTLYTWSSINTEEIGRQLAIALEKLIAKVPVENIHLIGHSLGAHIVGYAGHYFAKYTGRKLLRITGLDPANPCFGKNSLTGIERGDAIFVDIIHSNPGVLGRKNPVGDADFYPGGLEAIKPGCMIFGCSHGRAQEYYTESVYPGNEENFIGRHCSSLSNLQYGNCYGNNYAMGFAAAKDVKGIFLINVNGRQPYGKNAKGGMKKSSSCSTNAFKIKRKNFNFIYEYSRWYKNKVRIIFTSHLQLPTIAWKSVHI